MTSALNGAAAPAHTTDAQHDEILRVEDLKVHFPLMKGVVIQRQVATVKAVDGVSFALKRGDTLGSWARAAAASRRPVSRCCAC